MPSSNAETRLSVVIATKNRAPSLAALLEGLARQTVASQDFEVIIVDNQSSDETPRVAAEFVSRFPHWQHCVEKQQGAAAARNRGIRHAHASRILFLDDDIRPDRVLVEGHLDEDAEGFAILGSVRFPWIGNESALIWTLQKYPAFIQSFDFPDPEHVPFQYFYTCNLSMPACFFQRGQAFDETFTASGFEDIELGYRFVERGGRIVYRAHASAVHDVHLNYHRFSQKQRSNGRWLHHLLTRIPQARKYLIDSRREYRQRALVAIGFCAIPFQRFFDVPWGSFSSAVLPLLGRLCRCQLEYEFRRGFALESKRASALAG